MRILIVKEWGVRKTRKFITEQLDEINSRWAPSKIVKSRNGPYHILFLKPLEEDEHRAVSDAVRTIAELQKIYAEQFARTDAKVIPAPIMASFVMGVRESPHTYPFRLTVPLPTWDFPRAAAMHKNRTGKKTQIRQIASNTGYARIGSYIIPIKWWRKADAKVLWAAQNVAERHGLPPHLASGNTDEFAAAAAIMRENKDWKMARNVLITAPSRVKTRTTKNIGPQITELDFIAVGSNWKNIHVGEVKGVGPETERRWDDIVVHKAITLTPAMEMLAQRMGLRRRRLFPHFAVVSRWEHISTDLANRALITLKPQETFRRLEAHAVWPSGDTLLMRRFREPIW
ncbi:MAG: hypothetical protein GXN93_02515 [Candidatus Diapherotrites archaeon]|nr:hypothetical protein [Candidatus Diapherotrites archaeon]